VKPRILLVNPPIYDFSAYDFWLKPYGLLRVAGFMRGQADFRLFDSLDRFDPRVPPGKYRADLWGRGEFHSEIVDKPRIFAEIPRHFRRFGLPRAEFQRFLADAPPFDFALVQTGMTYWYPGVKEIIDDLRVFSPKTKIALGGVYATICASHAKQLDADFVVEGTDLAPLWSFLEIAPNDRQMPQWDLYPYLQTGVLKIADGCPFRCTYCSVPQVYPKFRARPIERSIAELEFLNQLGVEHVAFYDDALLYQPEQILKPFLRRALQRNIRVNFHTPNALNARFIDSDLAQLMVAAGFKSFYLGFESDAYAWQKKTGGKVYSHELERAVTNLRRAGADTSCLIAYLIVGHPNSTEQAVEDSMHFAHALGIKVMLSEFSPIPGTPDGDQCRRWIDLDEPLWHNKTAFTFHHLGNPEVNRLKHLAARLNHRIAMPAEKACGGAVLAGLVTG
jgi:pyruvate-formate lyase-activating enzyme